MTPFTRSEVQQPGGSLFKLLSELRLMIYEELFSPTTPPTLYAMEGDLFKSQGSNSHMINDSTAILITCQTIYAEARPVLLANNEFRILIRRGKFEEDADDGDINGARFHTHFRRYTGYWDDANMFTSLQGVRALTLDVDLRCESPDIRRRDQVWLKQVLSQINDAPGIKRLNLSFTTEPYDYEVLPSQSQEDFDEVIRTFKEIKCNGIITAVMDVSLGGLEFNSECYYDMVRSLGGIDKTRQEYVELIDSYSNICRENLMEIAELERVILSGKTLKGGGMEEQSREDQLVIAMSLGRKLRRLLRDVRSDRKRIGELRVEVEKLVGDRWPRLDASSTK